MTFEFDTAVEAFAFILKHLPLTLFLPAVTLLIGIVLGSIIAIVRLRSNKLVNAVLAVVVSFFRSVPAILQVFIMYYSLPYLIAPILSAVTGSVVKPFDVSPYWTAYIFFIIYQTAYQSENIRGALLSVDRGQLEAALAVGLRTIRLISVLSCPRPLQWPCPHSLPITCTVSRAWHCCLRLR